MKDIQLPNGLRIAALNQTEADALYCEIFEQQNYQRHGVAFADGQCVFDVGANIGLFSLMLTQTHQNLTVYAFEPIPALFQVLQRNANRYFPKAHLLNVGLSHQPGSARFTFKPALSMTTSMYPTEVADSVQKQAGSYAWIQALLADLGRTRQLPKRLVGWLNGLLGRPYVRGPVLALVLLPLAGFDLWQRVIAKRITCPLMTISQVIREHNVSRIDLLKIDVEGSELDVVQGIDDADWPRIGQLVIEIHDIDNRVQTLTTLLTKRGYAVTVEQQDWALLKLMNIYTLYATAPVHAAA